MKTILVTYASMAGSTEEVAQSVGDEIARRGVRVEVLPVDQVDDVKAYDGVVIGGPMIWGWHRAARAFLEQNRAALRHIPLAVFATAMSLTQPTVRSVGGVPVHLDEKLPKEPERPGHLNLRERYAQLAQLCTTHSGGRRPRQTHQHWAVWRPDGIWPAAVVGGVVRHVHYPGPGRRSPQLDGNPGLGGGTAGRIRAGGPAGNWFG